ncbi:MAG TPA: hypothetical protein VM287_15550 [Egibacteraceae bacterium]|nr:hypothetical protein [Egibacteraceae bacterium]
MASGRARMVVALLVLSLLVSCGDADDEQDASESPPATAGETPSPDPEASPIEAAPVVPVTPSPLEPRIEHRLEIHGDPDEIAAGAGAIWVKRANGMVDRIDPATNEIVFSVQVMTPRGEGWQSCAGLGVDEDSVWVCDDPDVKRLDPETGDVIATVAVDKVADQLHIPVGLGHAWVLSGDGSTLTGVSTADNSIDEEFDLGTRCVELALADDALWAACPVDDVVLRIDPSQGEVTATVGGLDNPRWISIADAVWVASDDGLVRLDPDSAEVTGAVEVRAKLGGSIFATPDAVWVRSADPFLRRVDPATLELVEEITTDSEAGGSVTAGFGSLWTSAPDDQVVYRISP